MHSLEPIYMIFGGHDELQGAGSKGCKKIFQLGSLID